MNELATSEPGPDARRRREIARYEALLAQLGLSLQEAVRACPRSPRARRAAYDLACRLAGSARSQPSPVQALREAPAPKRWRPYVLALAVLLAYELPSLQAFLAG